MHGVHGLIFTSFLEFADRTLGPAAGELRRKSPPFAASEAHDDTAFEELLSEAIALTGAPRGELLRDFGRYAATVTFAALYPRYYKESGDTRSFLLSVEERIHELVRAAIPGARPPQLGVTPLGPEGVAITYTSDRHLCELLEGLVLGTAEHYGESFSVEQSSCMLRGDAGCACFVQPLDATA